jgi:hypothetical protein
MRGNLPSPLLHSIALDLTKLHRALLYSAALNLTQLH